MTSWYWILIVGLLGLTIGRVWSDIIHILRIGYDERRDDVYLHAKDRILDILPRWLIVGVVVSGLIVALVGGAQVWQTYQFSSYQHCQATHDKNYDIAQGQRVTANLEVQHKLLAFVQAILPLFDPAHNHRDSVALQRATQAYVTASVAYFQTVDKNPFPESTIKLCGTPKG